jgi:hypothetical protein
MLLDATRHYSTLLDAASRRYMTRRFLTLLDASRRFSTLLDATRRKLTTVFNPKIHEGHTKAFTHISQFTVGRIFELFVVF